MFKTKTKTALYRLFLYRLFFSTYFYPLFCTNNSYSSSCTSQPIAKKVLPKVIWEEPCRHPSRQRMDFTPNINWIASCTSTQLCNKVPLVTVGRPKFPPIAFDDSMHAAVSPYSLLLTISTHLILSSLSWPHSKRHPDPISHFSTIQPPDRQTNRWETYSNTYCINNNNN